MNMNEIKALLEDTIKEKLSPISKNKSVFNDKYARPAYTSIDRSNIADVSTKKPLFLISNKSVSPQTYLPSPIRFPKGKPNTFARRYTRNIASALGKKPLILNANLNIRKSRVNIMTKRFESSILLLPNESRNLSSDDSWDSLEFSSYDLTPKLLRYNKN